MPRFFFWAAAEVRAWVIKIFCFIRGLSKYGLNYTGTGRRGGEVGRAKPATIRGPGAR